MAHPQTFYEMSLSKLLILMNVTKEVLTTVTLSMKSCFALAFKAAVKIAVMEIVAGQSFKEEETNMYKLALFRKYKRLNT